MKTARQRAYTDTDGYCKQDGGMVIGTGDLSELALGWATYNGDHMSMYGSECFCTEDTGTSSGKILCGYLQKMKLKEVLLDILDTPVSPASAAERRR